MLVPVALFSQQNQKLNLVWTASAQAESSTDIVWSSSAIQTGLNSQAGGGIVVIPTTLLPDSINHIKNVLAGTDVDQDGKQEFIVPIFHIVDGVARRSVVVFENSGDDSYQAVWSFTFDGPASQFVTVDVSDLDGDGNQEILVVHIPDTSDDASVLFAFEFTGTDNDFGTAPAVEWNLDTPGLDIVRVARAADLDGDGKQEVVMTTFTTLPALVIASVSDFSLPVWTTELSVDLGTTSPDIAAIGIGDMDNDGTPEVVTSDGSTDKLIVVEATGPDAYNVNSVDMPVAGKTVSVHGIDLVDANSDGRDEAYFANLQGAVWVVATNGDASAITTSNITQIADTGEQWLEASTGRLGIGGSDFVIAASNATKAVDFRYIGGPFGDVTDVGNYQMLTVVDSNDVAVKVPGGIRVYGLDIA
ncbi:MAG: FG-GAP repeat domain-containing protein, partial [bacterium]